MKNLKLVLLVLLSGILFTSCNRPDPEDEGVLMKNYGRNGIEDYTVVTGAQGPLLPGKKLYEVPMFEQTVDVVGTAILSSNSGEFIIDPSYTYRGIRGRGPSIVLDYRQHNPGSSNFLDNVEKSSLNKILVDKYRVVARSYTTDSIMNNLQSYENQVDSLVRKALEERGFELKLLTSGLTPPKNMIEEINRTNDAIQQGKRLDNELLNATKEQRIKEVEAETAKIVAKGLTPEILQMEFIKAIKEKGFVYITDGKSPLIMK